CPRENTEECQDFVPYPDPPAEVAVASQATVSILRDERVREVPDHIELPDESEHRDQAQPNLPGTHPAVLLADTTEAGRHGRQVADVDNDGDEQDRPEADGHRGRVR